VPIHWSDQTASSARVGDMVAPETDPHSGQPEAKATPAAVTPILFAARGFALSRRLLALPPETWWARVAVTRAWAYLLATNGGPAQWHDFALAAFGEEAVITEYIDRRRDTYRAAAFSDGRLDACLFIGSDEIASQWQTARKLFETQASGAPAALAEFPVPASVHHATSELQVCACFDIGLEAIRDAIRSSAAAGVDDIGRALRAGTKCGTCLPELRSIVADERLAHAN
jgi:assimilatory nitrate reductase catalytic subunit